MSERDDKVYLQDIISSIDAIEKYTLGISEIQFSNDQMMIDAVIRRFEIIGEASIHISKSFTDMHPDIEWRLMSDMRNKLIHAYFGVSSTTVYQTIHNDLPGLKKKLSALI